MCSRRLDTGKRRERSARLLGPCDYGVFPKAAELCLNLLQARRCDIL
jgi:hypothetical protein